VAKLPKVIYSHSYNVESMGKDLENMVICQRILHEFNDRIVDKISDTSLLLGIVSPYLYELDSEEEEYKIYYAENFIEGDYTKYNNNVGWIANQESKYSQITQAFSHFSS
jgi:hypoxanthine phosphoribosyltransferase